MSFGNLAGLLGLIGIPIIIVMYLMKQRYKERTVPSLALWQEALAVAESRKPWQKLNKSLLLFLQLLAVVLLALALSKPYVKGEITNNDLIIVIDNSLSMQTEDVLPNRFERAKEEAGKLVGQMQTGQSAAIVQMSNSVPVSAFSDDKRALVDKINGLTVSYTEQHEGADEIVRALLETSPSASVFVISDKFVDYRFAEVSNVIVGESAENMAVTLLSHTVNSEGMADVLVRVKNFGKEFAENGLVLYSDGELVNVTELALNGGESRDVFFYGIEGKELWTRLTGDDVLKADNEMFDVVYETGSRKVVLFTERNVFLESALAVLSGVELYRGSVDDIDNVNGYYLYIYDGCLPEKLPEDGHVLVFNPPVGNGLIETGDEFEAAGRARVVSGGLGLTEWITGLSFDVSKSKSIAVPEWAESVISDGENCLAAAGVFEGRKIAVFGFDLHNSDLPLKKEFPIFIYNLCGWFIPKSAAGAGAGNIIYTGGAVPLEPDPAVTEMIITNPIGERFIINPPFSGAVFMDTELPGHYVLTQTTAQATSQTAEEMFAVNVNPNSGESDLVRDYEGGLYLSGGESSESAYSRSVRWIFAAALIAVFAFEWFVFVRNTRSGRFSRNLYRAVRGVFFALVILSMTGLSVRKASDSAATVFAVDLSESMGEGGKAFAIQFIEDSQNARGTDDLVGTVCFGADSVIEQPPGTDNSTGRLMSHVDGGFTNISKALLLARTIMPEQSRKRITLISDGLENVDSAIAAANALRERGVTVDVLHYGSLPTEVMAVNFSVPKYLNRNVRYDINTEIYSTTAASGKIRVYKGNSLIIDSEVTFREGSNNFAFSDEADMYGVLAYRLEIQSDNDTHYQNNTLYAHTYVEDAPHILVIGNNGSADEAIKILEASRVRVRAMQPQMAPVDVAGLSAYDGVVLCDINIEDLPESFPAALSAYVKNTGGGVLATGGENSFALGGYYKTELETLLPVDMELKDRDEAPNLGMVVVMDRSGSMEMSEYGISRISLAKEAVIRAVDALGDTDRFGVLTFDSWFEWSVPFEAVSGNQSQIKDRIAQISSGGGTSILPALKEAFETVRNTDTMWRHIILLTDGEAEKTGYEQLINEMNENNVTLSCIAVGDGSDTTLLKMLANRGNGRYYYTDAFSDLPKIFTKETTLAGKAYLNNRHFYPEYTAASAIMSEISTIPALDGYVSTTAKDRADVILTSDEDEPVLASMQYGLGRTAAFTSDMNGLWSAGWLQSDSGVNIFRNTVSYILRKQIFADASLTAEIKGDYTELTLTMDLPETASIQGTITDASGIESAIEFTAAAPGIYKARAEENKQGAYIVNLALNGENIMLGVSIPYSREFDVTLYQTGLSLLKKIAEITGGRVLSSSGEVFAEGLPNVYGTTDISGILLIIALIVLLIDVMLRRFTFIPDALAVSISKIRQAVYSQATRKDTKGIAKDIKEVKENSHEHKKEPPKEAVGENNGEDNMAGGKNDTSSILLMNKKNRIGR